MGKKEKGDFFVDVFFGIRKRILLSFYIFSIVTVGILFIVVIGDIPGVSLRIQVLLGFFITIAGVVVGASLSVVLDLPNIIYDFDKIKNDIALKKIDSPGVFAQRLTSFLCNYFTFSFFRIKYAFVKIIDTECVYSDNSIFDAVHESDYDSILAKSRTTEEVIYLGKKLIHNESFHLYILPVWFGDDWLGFIGIFTTKKLIRLYLSFLADFEDHYVDDQLVHVLHIKRQKILNRFYTDINAFSINITRKVYATTQEYQKDILEYLVNTTTCVGGLFATVYDEDCSAFFKDEAFDGSQIKEHFRQYYADTMIPMEPRIISLPDIPFEHVFEIPLISEKAIGIIHLFDTTDHNFRYYYNMIVNVGNIRINYDLKNLASFLELTVQGNAFLKKT